jgi:spermidine synthase
MTTPTEDAIWYYEETACTSDIRSLYPIQRVYWKAKTPFADALITECPGLGKTLFLDNEIQSSEADEDIYHECLVHPVMASVPSGCRSRVLIIGGGEGATLREVLRWPDVQHVDWVDIDGELVNACRAHLGWVSENTYTDPRVTYHPRDIHVFFKDSPHQTYDVILVDLPDPDVTENCLDAECLMNFAFWKHLVHSALAPGGALVTHCGPVRRNNAQSGSHWIRDTTCMVGLIMPDEGRYHAMIPSFQDDWAYWMSCPPVFELPTSVSSSLRFLTEKAYRYIFQWAS